MNVPVLKCVEIKCVEIAAYVGGVIARCSHQYAHARMRPRPQPLTNRFARMPLLTAVARVAEGAKFKRVLSSLKSGIDGAAAAAAALRAVLRDTRNFSVLGGRPGAPRSIGSVHAAAVIRFLGGSLGGPRSRIDLPSAHEYDRYRMALSHNGSALISAGSYTSVARDDSQTLFVIALPSGDATQSKVLRSCDINGLVIAIAVAPDGLIYAAHTCTHDTCAHEHRSSVTIYTPQLDRQSVVYECESIVASSLCAGDDHVIVAHSTFRSDPYRLVEADCISVYRRHGNELLRSFGKGTLQQPRTVCFLPCQRYFAVGGYRRAEYEYHIFICGIDGAFVRSFGNLRPVFTLMLACSPFGEVVVANIHYRMRSVSSYILSRDMYCSELVVFSEYGEELETPSQIADFKGAMMHNGVLFTHNDGILTAYR